MSSEAVKCIEIEKEPKWYFNIFIINTDVYTKERKKKHNEMVSFESMSTTTTWKVRVSRSFPKPNSKLNQINQSINPSPPLFFHDHSVSSSSSSFKIKSKTHKKILFMNNKFQTLNPDLHCLCTFFFFFNNHYIK